MSQIVVDPENNPKLEPAIFIIFGITGDLSRRKLLPALYHLVHNGLLHDKTAIVGVTRRDVTADDLVSTIENSVKEFDRECDPSTINRLKKMLSMQKMDLSNSSDYDVLKTYLDDIENQNGLCMNRLFYLSIPPQVYMPIVRLLGERGLHQGCKHGAAQSRLLVEKPFGFDLKSAKDLVAETSQIFHENQIFRIDHYVAKETVQNILTFRFNNPLFTGLWDNRFISHLQITATEQIDIEGRATFYEETGALRDFVQSHLLQLLAILTMEEPNQLTSEFIHANKLKLLQQIQPLRADNVGQDTVRAQYDGYRLEVNNPRSKVETYAALRLSINTQQWQGVPILIRTGKALDKKETKLSVVFRGRDGVPDNSLRFRIQPDEGIALHLLAKRPGYDNATEPVVMDFSYEQSFNDHDHPDAYERVLVDAVRGDHTLFSTSEEVLASWRVLEDVVQVWSRNGDNLHSYHKGTRGPAAADSLAESSGCRWL